MKNIYYLIVLIITLLIIFNITHINTNYEVIYVTSTLDHNTYLVKNYKDSQLAANLLARIFFNIKYLANHLYENRTKDTYVEYKPYIEKLHNNLSQTIISENVDNQKYTSYTINKGEKIIFCIRSRKNNKLHDINILMYVALHEISHIACPEINHTELFKKIFAFITNEAIDLNIYQYENFKLVPKEYCGLNIDDSIV